MALLPAGKRPPPRKSFKGGTESSRKHRFESFNQRIAKLSIDPIRKTRQNVQQEEDNDGLSSFFATSLDRWKFLNLSANFGNFVGEVEPLCQSLPQVIHYEVQILELLVKYIDKQDTLSLEPLLDLLSSLARDLGARFEAHFALAVEKVALTAARNPSVEAIEWSFTCLSWLFKYLSRLLTPNLRPVFKVMAPLLGKEPQKHHTIKFAAEALSFLVRRAANTYERNPQPLQIIMNAIREDFAECVDVNDGSIDMNLYRYGIMSVMSNSMKGLDRKLHSCGLHVFRCLLDNVITSHSIERPYMQDILTGTSIALVHHTDAEGLEPLLQFVFNQVHHTDLDTASSGKVTSLAHLLYVFTTVRKGSRIRNWQEMVGASLALLISANTQQLTEIPDLFKLTAVVLHSAPLDIVLQSFRPIIGILMDDDNENIFLPFCSYFHALDCVRFEQLVMPHFSRFIMMKWKSNTLLLSLLLPKLVNVDSQTLPICPEDWQIHAAQQFIDLPTHQERLLECSQFLVAMRHMSLRNDLRRTIMDKLGTHIESFLRGGENTTTATFMLGPALQIYAQYLPNLGGRLDEWWPLICLAANRHGTLVSYLESISIISRSNALDFDASPSDVLLKVLMDNLHADSHPIRRLSLEILREATHDSYSDYEEIFDTALKIENSPLDLQAARFISMQTRKLASLYSQSSANIVIQALPQFCFGMLTYKLSHAWDDALAALRAFSDTRKGEAIVSQLAFDWLEQKLPLGEHTDDRQTGTGMRKEHLTEFECSNKNHLDDVVDRNVVDIDNMRSHLEDGFSAVVKHYTRDVGAARTLALRVLRRIPTIAEKRSRSLVPYLLDWAATIAHNEQVDESEESSEAKVVSEQALDDYWKVRDRKILIDLFSCFTNPRALYRADEVLEALKALLCSGDVDVQRSALKAIFTWKIPGILPHQERFLNMLDDARFRDEITLFMYSQKEGDAPEIRPDSVAKQILLRLLYGKMIARSGGNSGAGAQSLRRRVVLEAIYHLDDCHLAEFISISLAGLHSPDLQDCRSPDNTPHPPRPVSARIHLGIMNMMKSMLEVLGSRLVPSLKDLITALLHCLVRAINQPPKPTQSLLQQKEQTSLSKAVRHVGIQCLNLMAQSFPCENLRRYLPTVFDEVLSPRMEFLATETSQAVSGTLRLFATWASSLEGVQFLVDYDSRALKSITECLDTPSTKAEVIIFVLDRILLQITERCTEPRSASDSTQSSYISESLSDRILQPNMVQILQKLGILLRSGPNKDILASGIRLVARLSPLTSGTTQIKELLDISAFLIDQPLHRVSPKSKADLLCIIRHFLPRARDELESELRDRIYHSTSALFGFFKDRDSRKALVSCFEALAFDDSALQRAASLCRSLNAYDVHKVDEPDFNERLAAFNAISVSEYKDLSPRQWRPVLFTLLFHVKNEDEMAIRSNASLALRRYVEASFLHDGDSTSEFLDLTRTVLLRNLRKGISEPSELVRAEFLSIMEVVVRLYQQWEEVNDMHPLLFGNDSEASFFSNVLHIQQHRRLRAIRRLAREGSKGSLQSVNVAHFFIPLVEHFIYDKADDDSAHNLSAESVNAIGELAVSLEWAQFKAILQRFSSSLQKESNIEKSIIKLLSVTVEALSKAVRDRADAIDVRERIDDSACSMSGALLNLSALARTLPQHHKLADTIMNTFLPILSNYLHDKEESTVSLRTPVAVIIAKLLKLLPQPQFVERLPPLLTDICNILRSRAQESRDLTRKTLTDISILLGPSYFGFMLKELRSALGRGYQLHVLSYTMHSILVATSTIYKPGDLDYCLPQIVAVIMDDIFGSVGQEKDAEEYISKMKEVKASKSFDSMELVARTTTVEYLAHLLRPLQKLVEEKLDVHIMRKIDEILRRIGTGLIRNDAINDRRVLVFFHEIIREVHNEGNGPERRNPKDNIRLNRYLINYHGANKAKGSTSSYKYKLVRFALDTLRMVIQRYEGLQSPTNIHGFIPIMGDALICPNDEIQTAALRLLTTLVRVPLKSIDENAPVYVAECVKIVKASTSTNVDLVQAALKLVAVILRERHTIEIRENDVAYLLNRLAPDLDEPDKQGVVFSLLKAVMSRKIVIPEIYKVLDDVRTIMVANQTKSSRDMARGAYIQFIMEYPQGKERLSKQVGFLIRNLDYTYEEGRQSVMEAIHLLFNKSGDDHLQTILGSFFIPLVMVIINDESSPCREMAGALLKTLFACSESEQIRSFLATLKSWLSQSAQPILTRVAFQVYGIFIEQKGSDVDKEIQFILPQIAQTLKSSLKEPAEEDWELVYYVLQAFTKISQLFPASAFTPSTASTWCSICRCLSYPHAWVKTAAAKVMGLYFADFARSNTKENQMRLPMKGSQGLWLSEIEVVEATRASLALLNVPGVAEDLAAQSVRNLAFLGKIMAQVELLWPQQLPEPVPVESDTSNDDSSDDGGAKSTIQRTALSHLISQACGILRHPPMTNRASSLVPLLSTVQLLAVITNHMSTFLLQPVLATILLPLQNLNDPNIPTPFSTDPAFNEGYRSLASNARELLSNLQDKFGTTEYVKVLHSVNEERNQRRQERRTKRAIERVAYPEKAGVYKKRKGEKKREKRKERSGEERSRRRGW